MTILGKAIENYLALRRGLGFKLIHHGYILREFALFMEQHGADHVKTALALQWAALPQNVQPAHWAQRLGMVRGFARHWSAVDPRSEVPPQGLLPHRYARTSPHIYTPQQIAQLIAAAKTLPSKTGLRPWTYATLFGLLAVTGLRISEVIALDRNDLDWNNGVLTVRQTKFGKSRLVPVHHSTLKILRHYESYRDRTYPQAKTPSFFLSEHGVRPSKWAVRATFVKLSRQIGLRGETDSHGPRLHDLRHSLAVKILTGWYRAGLNIDQQLPKLSTFLGHTHVADTYWYLSATAELLRLASERLNHRKGGRQ